jgi:hypothetical protein
MWLSHLRGRFDVTSLDVQNHWNISRYGLDHKAQGFNPISPKLLKERRIRFERCSELLCLTDNIYTDPSCRFSIAISNPLWLQNMILLVHITSVRLPLSLEMAHTCPE